MTCFLDHIGLNYCEPQGVYDIPSSGIYLTSLPGISLESLQKIANAEQETYMGVWEDLQNYALAQFRLDLLNEIKKCYEINKDCDYDALACENLEILTLAWKYLLGVTMMLFRLNSDRVNRWTTITREDAERLRDFYQNEYERALHQGVLLMNMDSCCLECGGNPNVVVWLP